MVVEDRAMKFEATKKRDEISVEYNTLSREGPTKCVEIGAHRDAMEEEQGTVGIAAALVAADLRDNMNQIGVANYYSDNAVDVALTVYDNLLIKPQLRTLIFDMDEKLQNKSLWRMPSKLEAVIIKSGKVKDENRMAWMISDCTDMMYHKKKTAEDLSLAVLTGKGVKNSGGRGVLDLSLLKLDLRQEIFDFMERDSFFATHRTMIREVFECHKTYRRHFENLSWLGAVPAVVRLFMQFLESVVFKDTFDAQAKLLCKNGKTAAEILRTSPFADELESIKKKIAIEQTPDETVTVSTSSSSCRPAVEDIPTTLPSGEGDEENTYDYSIAIGGAGFDRQHQQKMRTLLCKLTPEQLEIVRNAQVEASKLCSTFIEVIRINMNDAELTEIIKGSVAGKCRDGTTTPGLKYTLCHYDLLNSGESHSQPWCRKVQVNSNHVKKIGTCINAAHGAFEEMHDHDLFILNDGGKQCERGLMGMLIDAAGNIFTQKSKKLVHILYPEEGVVDSLDHSARGAATVDQLETIHIVTRSALRVQKRNRVAGPGTTSGTGMSHIPLGRRDEVWKMTFEKKKEVYGSDHRPLPGNAGGASERVVRRDDDVEPVTYWPRSRVYYKELLNYDVQFVLDCTPLVPLFGLECIVQGIPYCALAFTEVHAQALREYFLSGVFAEMREEKSAIFRADLARVFSDASKTKPTTAAPFTPTPPQEAGSGAGGPGSPAPPAGNGAGSPAPALTPHQKEMLAKLKQAAAGANQGADEADDDDSGPET